MTSPFGWLRASAARMNRPKADGPDAPQKTPRTAVVIVTLAVAAIVGLSLWYLVQPQPLLVQGEADATRIDIAARVDGRVGQRPVDRGENVAAGQLLVAIDNPELLTKLKEAEAAQAVALADLTRIEVGTRAEVVAAAQGGGRLGRGQPDARAADLRPDQAADAARLRLGRRSSTRRRRRSTWRARSSEQAKLAYEEAVAGYTAEERGVAKASGRQGRRGDRDAARRRSTR